MEFMTASDGLRIAYAIDDYTDPWKQAPTLILLHSAMSSSRRLYAMVPYFARDFRVVRMDLRGHGESQVPRADQPLNLARLTEDVLDLMDHLKVDAAHFLGENPQFGRMQLAVFLADGCRGDEVVGLLEVDGHGLQSRPQLTEGLANREHLDAELPIDLLEGTNVDRVLDICLPQAKLKAALGDGLFDLVICNHVLEHTRDPWKAARTMEKLLRPGGLLFVSSAWSQAFHATPDDLWRFSIRGLMRLFPEIAVTGAFYSGGDVGLDVAYRIECDGTPVLDARSGAVEQGLFQLVLDHEDNRAVLSRQATYRLPVSRTYLPTLFANLVGQRPK